MIPRRLHRVIPLVPPPAAELYWERFAALHPDFELISWRDPLDPADFPIGGGYWPACSSGAQFAGIVRLEVLWHHGGIYVDQDVEPFRSFEPLLETRAFAAWEDERVIPDAVLGAEPGHPAILEALELALFRVEGGEKAWRTGPGVTTEVLAGRPDVLVLPPATFYPYHYTEKHRRGDDHGAHPWTFAAHHWDHSWRSS